MDLQLPEKYMTPIPLSKYPNAKKTEITSGNIANLFTLLSRFREWKKKACSPLKRFFNCVLSINLNFFLEKVGIMNLYT